MFKKIIITVLFLAGVVVAYWLISPLFIEERVSENVEDIVTGVETLPTPEVLKTGEFNGLAGHDSQGTVILLQINGKHYVRFEDDFRVTNGPDLFVYFGRDGEYVAEARISSLKGNAGSQNYEVPVGINPADYNEIWVWCRAFSVPFANAKLL